MEDKTEGVSEFKPGETIHPGDAPVAPTTPPETATPAATPTPPSATEPAEAISTGLKPPEETITGESPEQITWTASEFVDHDKSIDWYLGLAVVAALSAVALYVFFRDIITSVTPLVAALAFGFYGRRRPRQLQYRVDSHGLTIGEKFMPYETFRSFAVMEEDAFASIAFLPMKRFGMLTTVYLDPQDENRIIDLLSQYLPLEPREHDAVDRLMKRIRF